MVCQRCNTENLDGSQYCDECGALLGGNPNLRTRFDVATSAQNGDPHESVSPAAPDKESPAPALRDGFTLYRADNSAQENHPRPIVSLLNNAESGPSVRSSSAGGQLSGAQEARAAVASAASTAAPHAKLVIHRGRSVGKEFPLCEDETHIGRWDADGGIFPDVDLDADDPEAKVSRRHARITRRNGQYFVEDLGSTNGTFINRGRRLLPGDRHPLHDGDEVIVGKTFLRFHVIG